VMFMQAGFAFLEIGFSRSKNAGSVIAKILTNFSIAGLCYWAVGFALAFGVGGSFAGTHGWFVNGASGGRAGPLSPPLAPKVGSPSTSATPATAPRQPPGNEDPLHQESPRAPEWRRRCSGRPPRRGHGA